MTCAGFCTVAFTAAAVTLGCGGGTPRQQRAESSASQVRIGLLLDTLAQERWVRDRDLFVARAKERRAEVLVEAAEGDDARQVKQAEELLAKGVKVLVVVPYDTERAAAIVEAAHRQKVPVISYDRLIRNADVDLYVSFDNVKVGEMQASYLLTRAPKGNYLLIGGAPTDNNAKMLREGQMKALKAAIARGDIKIVGEPWADNWEGAEAKKHTQAALKKTRNKLAAVVASNDVTAGGVVEALQEQQLAGKVLVSGQDAELEGARRIVQGVQAMTVYKPLRSLARLAADSAITLASGERVDTMTTINNGKKDVPVLLLEPLTVDKDNMDATVIRDGYQKREDVYAAPKP